MKMNNITIVGLIFLLIPAIWLPVAQAAPATVQHDSSGIRYHDGMLSADLKDKPLFDVLKILSQTMGVKIETVAVQERPVSVTFSEMSLEQGLKRLLSPQSFVFVYLDKNKKTEGTRLDKIIIYGDDGKSENRQIGGDTPPAENQVERERDKPRSLTLGDYKGRSVTQVKNTRVIEPSSLQELADTMKDPDPDLREDALYDIASDYEAEALPYLEQALTQDGNDDVRITAAELLGDIDSEASVSALTKGLQDANEDVRWAVVDALETIGGAKVLPALKTALQEKNEDLREEVEYLIKDIEGEGEEEDFDEDE